MEITQNMIGGMIDSCHRAGIVPLFLSSPGVGKTSAVREYCQENELELITFEAALREPVDLRGIPMPDTEKGVTKWLTPDEFPKDGKGVLFLDDVTAADPSMHAALFRLALEGVVGEYRLPDGWRVVMAGNRSVDMAGAIELNSALVNRLAVFTVNHSVTDWQEWAKKEDLPKVVIKFSEEFPEIFNDEPNQSGFCSPRSLAALGRLIKAGAPNEIATSVLGEKIGKQFVLFAANFNETFTVTLKEIVNDPRDAPTPEDEMEKARITKKLAEVVAGLKDYQQKAVAFYVNRLGAEYHNTIRKAIEAK